MSDKFKMAPTPDQMTDTGIHRLWDQDGPTLPTEISAEDISRANLAHSLEMWDEALQPARALAAAFDRLEKIMHQPPEPTNVVELMFHTNKRRGMEFDRVPVGHSVGYRCYDSGKHESAESAFQAGEYGDGLTEDQAYVDYLHALDDANPPSRPGMVVHTSPFEPPTVIDVIDRDDE